MRRLQVGASIVVGVGLLGCPSAPPLPSDATGTTDDQASESGTSTNGASSSMTSVPTSSSSTPTESESSDPTSDTTSTSAASSESSSTGPACVDGELGGACDPLGDDCPECAKCMPYADDGGDTWNASACSPVVPTPDGVGDSCSVAGSVASGLDTCDHGSMCWGVHPTSLEGTCVPLCSGIAGICRSPDDVCLRAGGVMAVCVAGCDPLLQDCSDEHGCYPAAEDAFGCVPTSADASVYAEACDGFNACGPGLFCADAGAVPACGGSCCSEFCDLSDPEASANCAGAAGGQECVAWFEAGQAPPGYEDVGACTIP